MVENNFDETKSILSITEEESEEVLVRVKSKLDTWLVNISKDVETYKNLSFDEIKLKLNSKYKNLPQKFHSYLDEVIKNIIKESY